MKEIKIPIKIEKMAKRGKIEFGFTFNLIKAPD
jgi:hypothetical protein